MRLHHTGGHDSIVEVRGNRKRVARGEGARSQEVEEIAMAVIGAAAGDGGDDATGRMPVKRRVILAGYAELAYGGLGEGVGDARVTPGAFSG